MDKDVEIQLVEIVTAVSGNYEGSAEEELGGEGVGEADVEDEDMGNSGEQDGSNLPASTVIMVHGDLTTKERIVYKKCIIESESKGQLAFVIFAPRLFHLKMAAIDAY